VHFVDTAGLRDSTDPVERIGIARTWSAIEQADLAVLVIDASKGETQADQAILQRLPKNLKRLRAYNKCDLAGWAPGRRQQVESSVVLSAKTGAGLAEFQQAVAEAIGWQGDVEGVFMARARHLEALRAAQAKLAYAGEQGARQELFAEELRRAHEALMSITGVVTADDLLGEIFSRFCIGK